MSARKSPDLSEQLRAALRADGRSAYVIEQASGVSRTQVSRFLAGERDLTLATAARLAAAIGLRFAAIETAEPRGLDDCVRAFPGSGPELEQGTILGKETPKR